MPKIGFVSLGCPKNLVDSEVMLGFLARAGYDITNSPDNADVIVVNTCGFIAPAQQESVDTILEMAEKKEQGRCQRLVVAGCLVEHNRKEILRLIPEVDAVVGTNELPKILEACDPTSPTTPTYEHREEFLYSHQHPRLQTTAPHTAYLKIAEGCDHPCTFCIIPQLRGRFRSRPIDSVLLEAERLVASGVREINLIGQDTTMYGWDHGNRRGLADLIRALGRIESLDWVRFLYAYPNHVNEDLLGAIASTPNACKYMDMPLQHASKSVLKQMKRGGNGGAFLSLLKRIRQLVPDCTIRTTMIVGFPGETERDFQDLLEFVQEAEFDRLGVFSYSDETRAVSNGLALKVPEEVSTERRNRLMEVQSRISLKKNESLLGQTVPVLLEGPSKETDLLWEGRLRSQAPDVDGVVYINDGLQASSRQGEIYPVRINEAHNYDFVGAIVQ